MATGNQKPAAKTTATRQTVTPEQKQEIANVQQERLSVLQNAPAFLADEKKDGMELLRRYVKPPRLKIIQNSSSRELKEQFAVGSVIIQPSLELLAEITLTKSGQPEKSGASFFFTPVFFYPEWVAWNPIAMKDKGSIRERTTNPKSRLAAKCRNGVWKEPHPENPAEMIRNSEHLNFVCMLHDVHGDLHTHSQAFVMSFARGEWKTGSAFGGLIASGSKAIFSRVYEAHCEWRPGTGTGDWYGLEIDNPSEESGVSPWVPSAELYNAYKAVNIEMTEAHANDLLQVDFDDADTDAGFVPADSPGVF